MEHAKRRQLLQGPFFVCPLRGNSAFTLIELIGVIAIISILAGMIAPNVIGRIKAATQEAEVQNLKVIAQGIELYLRKNRDFPATLSALSPEYVPYPTKQLTRNTNNYERYYFVQPNLSSFSNATGLTSSELADARFLLISRLDQDAALTEPNDAQFESWWGTDETSTPDTKIYRGHVGHLFYLISLSADGAGGSYSIDGTPTNSGGSTLSLHTNYHIAGTRVALDEANTYATPEVEFALTVQTGYQFDPDCTAGSQWRVISSGCYSS